MLRCLQVTEEKCDTITSSLMQQQHHQINNMHGLPQLQRLHPLKRFANAGIHNLLGNALLQPKRKRGRPRKLSGSSNGVDDFDRADGLVQGSPEMMEMKMGVDGFAGNNSDSSSGRPEGQESEEGGKVKQEVGAEPVAGSSKEGNSQATEKNPASTPTKGTENDYLSAGKSNLTKLHAFRFT